MLLVKNLLLLVGILVSHSLYGQADSIISRYRQFLTLTLTADEDIQQWANKLNSRGSWPDINYQDTERNNWQPLNHLKRIRSMAFAYSKPGSRYYRQRALQRQIQKGLRHWLQHRYQCPNWWHNEIGVPQQMRDIIILLQEYLSDAEKQSALNVMAQYSVKEDATGANLIWSADLGLHYGVLTNNPKLIEDCVNRLVGEIKITTKDGVQPDYSFHQHDKRLQMYQYGAAFLLDNIRLAWQLSGTGFAYPEDKLTILKNLLLKGWQWMARGIHTVPGTMDRSSSRRNALRSPDIRKYLAFIRELFPLEKQAIASLSDHQNGRSFLHGFRYFPYSDFAVYQQPQFSFFLKTISERTLATESINNENLKGKLLNSGDSYLIQNGNEYFNLMPFWNWDYLPGVTAFRGAEQVRRKPFTGSIGNSDEGFTSMDYILETKDGKKFVEAKKSWFCYQGSILCLIGDLKGTNVAEAYTAIDQARWQDEVWTDKTNAPLTAGLHHFNGLKWIYHNRFLYMPIGNSSIDIELRRTAARWSDINTSESDSLIHDMVFTPIIQHKNLNAPQSFAYLMMYSKNLRAAKINAKARPPFIVQNNSTCQSVRFSDGMLMAAFFAPGTINFDGNTLNVNQPCLVMIKNGVVYCRDLVQQKYSVKIKLNHKMVTPIMMDVDSLSKINSTEQFEHE